MPERGRGPGRHGDAEPGQGGGEDGEEFDRQVFTDFGAVLATRWTVHSNCPTGRTSFSALEVCVTPADSEPWSIIMCHLPGSVKLPDARQRPQQIFIQHFRVLDISFVGDPNLSRPHSNDSFGSVDVHDAQVPSEQEPRCRQRTAPPAARRGGYGRIVYSVTAGIRLKSTLNGGRGTYKCG